MYVLSSKSKYQQWKILMQLHRFEWELLVSAVSRLLDCLCFKCTLLCVLSIMRSSTNHVGPFSYSTWQATVETETMISCIENQLLPTSPWLLFPQCLLMAVAVVIRRANPCVLRCFAANLCRMSGVERQCGHARTIRCLMGKICLILF